MKERVQETLPDNHPNRGYEQHLREGEWVITLSPIISFNPRKTEPAWRTVRRLQRQGELSTVRSICARTSEGKLRICHRAIVVSR